jgi:ABC-type molybdate transport system substrate-binding protein
VVEIPDQDNVAGISTVASLKNAPHPEAAEAFLDFLVSEKGLAVYRKYGFEPPPAGSSE